MSLKLVHRKGSNQFYLRGTVRGVSVFETTGTDDPAAAEAIRIRREGELLHQSVFGQSASVSFAEAALSYIEDGGEKRYLGGFDDRTGKWMLLLGHFGTISIGRIGQHEADRAAIAICPTA